MSLLDCQTSGYPFYATSSEPLRWNVKEITYKTVGSDKVIDTIVFKMNAVEVFSHEYSYDGSGNLTKVEVK